MKCPVGECSVVGKGRELENIRLGLGIITFGQSVSPTMKRTPKLLVEYTVLESMGRQLVLGNWKSPEKVKWN